MKANSIRFPNLINKKGLGSAGQHRRLIWRSSKSTSKNSRLRCKLIVRMIWILCTQSHTNMRIRPLLPSLVMLTTNHQLLIHDRLLKYSCYTILIQIIYPMARRKWTILNRGLYLIRRSNYFRMFIEVYPSTFLDDTCTIAK